MLESLDADGLREGSDRAGDYETEYERCGRGKVLLIFPMFSRVRGLMRATDGVSPVVCLLFYSRAR